MEEEALEALPVRLKYYTTLILGLVSCLSSFIFFFMVPFFLEPSISTLIANFDPDPILCRTVYIEYNSGIDNCSWTSCREGCTTNSVKCFRIYADYIMTPYSEFEETDIEERKGVWDMRGTPVFVNIKACGYPPSTNCSQFNDTYGIIGQDYPCYYSRTDPRLVITDYSWGSTINSLIAALIIPNLLTGISLTVLSYWWYPGCQKRSCQYEMPPDQEVVDSQHCDEDDENDKEKETTLDDDDEKKKCIEKEKQCDDEKNDKQLAIEISDEKV